MRSRASRRVTWRLLARGERAQAVGAYPLHRKSRPAQLRFETAERIWQEKLKSWLASVASVEIAVFQLARPLLRRVCRHFRIAVSSCPAGPFPRDNGSEPEDRS